MLDKKQATRNKGSFPIALNALRGLRYFSFSSVRNFIVISIQILKLFLTKLYLFVTIAVSYSVVLQIQELFSIFFI